MSGLRWVWHYSGCEGMVGVVWGIILGGWGRLGGGWSIVLGEMGSVGKYLGWEWVGWGQCGSVHCLIMPNFNCVCVKR